MLLGATVGVPYALLASTAPLLQAWFARTHAGNSPYRLYAVSNAGSLLALLSYPFVFEPFLRLRVQTWAWSGGFMAFVLLMVVLTWGLFRLAGRTGLPSGDPNPAAAKEADTR